MTAICNDIHSSHWFEYTAAVNQKNTNSCMCIPKHFIIIINGMWHYGCIAHFFLPVEVSSSNLCVAINAISNFVALIINHNLLFTISPLVIDAH